MANKYLHIGVGGRRCACCFPRPGSNDRRKQFRRAKRRMQRAVAEEIQQAILDEEELRAELEAKDWEAIDQGFYFYDEFDDDYYKWRDARDAGAAEYSHYSDTYGDDYYYGRDDDDGY